MKLLYYIWSFVERFGTSAVSFVGNLVLAYMLTPGDFGLVAMLGVFTSLIFTLVDCGLSDGLLRESNPSDRDFNTLFYFNLATGTALCLLYVALSPVVAWYMNRPELQPVMALLSLGAVLSALPIAQLTRLRSQLKFRLLAVINLASICTAVTVAIVMARCGCSYWSLVALQLVYPATMSLLLVLLSRWRLRWEFDVARFKQLWKFGVNLLISTVCVQLSQNIFAFVLGKYYNPVQAGYMGQAQKLQQTPTNSVEASISSTSFVLIAKEEDPERRRAVIVRMLGIITLVIALMCGTLIGLGHPIVSIIFPERWLPVVPYMQLMAMWGLFYPINNFMGIIFKLYDRTSVIRNVIIAEKLLIVIAALSLHSMGIEVVMVTAAAISAVMLCVYMVAASRVTSIPVERLAWTYVRSVLAALPLAALAWLF
ncbi:MAG: lipopolysaccharide biosynthesis protein [Muribaculaceae bacterium]|nr:lipopolysaccharide biosynthesis protein [Muribaculaceae bacterium]